MYKTFLKRTVDLIAGILVVLMASPLLLIISLVLVIANHGRPFFLQERPGRDERIFRIIKFRTMNDNKDDKGHLLPDRERLTVIGGFIRKTSLDEVLQFINIIKGEMSLVGPRPLLPEYLPLYSKEQSRRHNVRPGITGWAQVNGRNAISWSEKLELDIWYIDHLSFSLDMKILFLTCINVLTAKGISKNGHATTERFNGHN